MNELLLAFKSGIDGINKLSANLQNAVVYANNITREAEAKLKEAQAIEAKNSADLASIISREAKVAKIEGAIEKEAKGEALLKEVKALKVELEKERSDFNEEIKIKSQAVNSTAQKNAEDKELLDRGWEKVRKLESELKEKMENMRETVLKELKALK